MISVLPQDKTKGLDLSRLKLVHCQCGKGLVEVDENMRGMLRKKCSRCKTYTIIVQK